MMPPVIDTHRAICARCRHYRTGAVCAAYPDGIPLAIVDQQVIHDHPLPGDHGIQFEPIEDRSNT